MSSLRGRNRPTRRRPTTGDASGTHPRGRIGRLIAAGTDRLGPLRRRSATGLAAWRRLKPVPRRLISGGAALVLLAGVVVWLNTGGAMAFRTTVQTIHNDNPDEPADLDTTLYVPAVTPAPAVLLAHGFGGSKNSVDADASDLAGQGYVVLAWSARGFGRSTGRIHLDSPDYEVADARHLVDWLAKRPEVVSDGPGDPRVAAVGGSYGGGLALMLAGYDQRVDAIVPQITWHDLAGAFLPEASGRPPADGVFKRAWAGLFFGTASGAVPSRAGASGLGGSPGADQPAVGGAPIQTTGPSRAPTSAPTGPPPDGSAPGGGPAAGATPNPNPASPTPPTSPGAKTEPTAPASAGTTAPHAGSGTTSGSPGAGAGSNRSARGFDPQCGRFAADVCRAYLAVATTGRGDADTIALLRRSSPVSVLDRITAPTLLVQGEADSLFPLSEADANARGIAAHHTPVRLAWFTGGHDGGTGPQSDQDRLKFLTLQWLDHYLKHQGAAPSTSFTYSRIAGVSASRRVDGGFVATGYSVADYPGLTGQSTTSVVVTGPTQPLANPPDGTPAALSSLPLAGGLASLVNGVVADIPGQHARFESAPLEAAADVAGSPTVQIRAASPTGEAVLFVKLYDVGPDGQATLPDGLAAPVRLGGLPTEVGKALPVKVTLPAIVHRFEKGHRLRLVVATSDQAYATPVAPVVYTAAVESPVTLPTVTGTPIASTAVLLRAILIGLASAVLLGVIAVVLYARWRHRRRERSVVAEYAETPLVVRDLRKVYGDGFVALSKVDFTVERNQVVGLLGPNGAGKTTTLRVLMGLTRASGGEMLIFGHALAPGAPVLSRLGALVEGPGFLPHLSGLANLELYWRATGRPDADSGLDEVLEIAGLGEAIHRKVRTYSHGMKQRLAIAQAMLGKPELLVLDEPTDGLDPPQIAEMRRVLRRYATDGRAVLVSSHLLAEVEQTCTHVVVVHQGEIVASGPVSDVVGDSPTVQIDVNDLDGAEAALRPLGLSSVAREGSGLVVDADGVPRATVVATLVRAGVEVERVVPRRRLEDAFLALVGGQK